MLRHNLLIILRNARRSAGVFAINLIGLASGLTCALLIYLWVKDEVSMDAFYKNGDRIYFAWEHRKKADGIWTSSRTNGPLGQALKDEVPEVELTCTTTRSDNFSLQVKETELKVDGRYAGKDFFELFSLPMVEGKAGQVLNDMKSIVISRNVAKMLFGDTGSALNQMIEVDHGDQFIVSGVFEDLPQQSSERFDFVLSFSFFESKESWAKEWGSTSFATYVLLREGTDINQVNAKIADFVSIKTSDPSKYKTLFLKPFQEVYLYSEYLNGVQKGGRIVYVKLFSIIALFILSIACINFMNLSTAKSAQRIKEVGIKKAMGAGRWTLLAQHIGESLVTSYLALLLALLVTDLCMRPFNNITGKSLSLQFDGQMIVVLLAIGFITGLLAGTYPAFYVSAFRPATTLKGKLHSSLGEVWIRKGLVVFQFALSVILIVSVLVVQSQIAFVQEANLGYDRSNVLMMPRQGDMWDVKRLETFLAEAERIPGKISSTVIGHNMTGHNSGTWGLVWNGKDPNDRTEFEQVGVGNNVDKVFGFQIIQGRGIDGSNLADSNKLVINETAAKFMALKNPIGEKVTLWGKESEIVGIVKDFSYESLHQPNKPLFFRLNNNAWLMAVKIEKGKEQSVVASLQELHQKINPKFTFVYNFLDDQYQRQYASEQRVSKLSRYFAGLAILISCLGLLGLAAFTAERRTKEIGIRKVLGSSEMGIVYLLTSEFTKIVLLSVLISLPVSYFASNAWLDTFAFRTSLNGWYFLIAGLLAVLIAWFTVSIQAFRAARANPASCLRDQ
ncbi:ABC transporter permease [Chryseolinea sp. T2]|uniref:ABC transporter permease n=1 Tax=Chryseolinea sp. T2 TaxID=3129255 RepID=UPI003077DE5D